MKLFYMIYILTALILISCQESTKKVKQSPKLVKKEIPRVVKIDSTISDPLETGVIKLLISNHMNSYFLLKGEERGLEFELLSLYAKDRRLKIELELLDGLNHLNDSIVLKKAHLAAASLMLPEYEQTDYLMTDYLYPMDIVMVHTKKTPSYSIRTSKVPVHAILDGPFAKAYLKNNNLSKKIKLVPGKGSDTKQSLVIDVAKGKIKYTLCGRLEAEMMQAFYPNLVVNEKMAENKKIAFAVHPKLKAFKADFDNWLAKNRSSSDFQWTVFKYMRMPRDIQKNASIEIPKKRASGISSFDTLLKKYAAEINWDWLLIAALIHQESRFDIRCHSWAGARGLMQIMPRTGLANGAGSINALYHPETNLRIGTHYLKWIKDNFFHDLKLKPSEREKFILAAYNVGPGHVQDAIALAKKHQLDPTKWQHISKMLLAKSSSVYYRDPVCKHGYCNGLEPVKYVENILLYYRHYSEFIEE